MGVDIMKIIILLSLLLFISACATGDNMGVIIHDYEHAQITLPNHLERNVTPDEDIDFSPNYMEYIFIEYEYPIEVNFVEYEEPLFETIFMAEPLPEHIIDQIMGVSFHKNPHFGLDHLSYLTVTHVNFYGISMHGHIIVAASIAEEVLDIFQEIYEARFPIERIRLIDYYDADDELSMEDNNSVGFNFRYIANTQRLSNHAWGMAIDINPVQNPFYRDGLVLPVAGAAYMDRDNVRPGMIVPGDAVYNAFISRGWTWGGHWRVPIDYHHFERRQ